MTETNVYAAVRAVRRLNPHPQAFAQARWVPGRDRYEFPIYNHEMTEQLAEDHVRGKRILGAIAADDSGYTTSVGVDIDGHSVSQKPKAAARRFIATAQALQVPVVVHSSKGGKGTHVRTLFSAKVPSFLARALYVAIVVAAGVQTDSSFDKVWPPSTGRGVLALPYNAKCAQTAGGALALDPNTLEPLPKDAQIPAVLEADEFSRDDLDHALYEMGVRTERDAEILAGRPRRVDTDGTRIIKDGQDGGIQVMLENCDAVRRLDEEAVQISYEFWFSMMTNFKPFMGGQELFVAYSQLDPRRFRPRELERSWKAISGGPRLCTHLDTLWQCPRVGSCPARSPAGLPFKRGGRNS